MIINTCKNRHKPTRKASIELYRHLLNLRWITTDRDVLHKKIRLQNFLARHDANEKISVTTRVNNQSSWFYFLKSISNYNYIFELGKIMPGTSGLCTRGRFWFPSQQESIFFQTSVRNRFSDTGRRKILSEARLYRNLIPRTVWNEIIWASVPLRRLPEKYLGSLLFTNCYFARVRAAKSSEWFSVYLRAVAPFVSQ